MRSNHLFAILGAAALLTSFTGAVGAQPPTPPIVPNMHGHSGMGGMRGRMGGQMSGMGSIIGNKNTKVYHLAGDKGNMPAEKNRVYFRTEREATAAGYHLAGAKQIKKSGMFRPHGSMTHPMSGGSMNGHLPK